MKEEELIERLAVLECICSYLQDLLCDLADKEVRLVDSSGADSIAPCHEYLHWYSTAFPLMVETPVKRRDRINEFIKRYNDNS